MVFETNVRNLLEKDPELRADHSRVKSSQWFRYYQESDISDEETPTSLEGYNFLQNQHVFNLFESILEQQMTVPEFFKILSEQKLEDGNMQGWVSNVQSNPKSQNRHINSEYFPEPSQVSETERGISPQFVESQLISLENSIRSLQEALSSKSKWAPGKAQNGKLSSKEWKLAPNSELSRGSKKPCLESKLMSISPKNRENSSEPIILKCQTKEQKVKQIFNQMITQSGFRKGIKERFENNLNRDNLTLSKSMSGNQKCVISKPDKLVLYVLHKMRVFGFPLKVIKKSLMARSLDCVASTFRLMSISLADDFK